MSDELVYVGSYPDTLGDGRPLANGDAVKLTAEERKEPHNARLITEQRLVTRPTTSASSSGRRPRTDGDEK